MSTTATNPYEALARQAKVDAVVALLDRSKNENGHTDRDVAALLCKLSPKGWAILARQAGVKPLSEQSRKAVLRAFEQRIRGEA